MLKMAKPEYWSSEQCREHLGSSEVGFRQIVFRQTRKHEAEGCIANTPKCHHIVVDHRGGQSTFYVAQNVIDYALVRRGELVGVNARKNSRKRREFDNVPQRRKK